jgi:peptide/nickel transport system permease protein
MRLSVSYIAKRFLSFVIVVWVAASVNFIVPRLAPGDPIGAMVARMELQGEVIENSAELIKAYREKFGLDGSLWDQYVSYLSSAVRFEFGFSLSNFPRPVSDIILDALPYTFALLTVSLLVSFTIGTLLGALIVWLKIGRSGISLVAPLLLLGSIPYYLLAIILLFIFSFALQWFPSGGARSLGASTDFTIANMLDVMHHGALPVMSIVLASAGGWLIGMRGMTITVTQTDYLTLAKAKGLSQLRIFYHYVIRNAILPQVTSLAIAMGNIVGGSILVEIIFRYPGLGSHLVRAINNQDFTVIQGITYTLVFSVALAVFVLDLVYPKLDPRITYESH